MAEAICPHLGADLGPNAGAKLNNGCIVCPFHGFEYDAQGRCVATPYAPPPRSAKLRVFKTCEIMGLIFAWYGSGGRDPQWHLPDPPDAYDWHDPEICSLRFRGHPQETTENSVDIGHLRYVHGYGNVKRNGTVLVDGPRFESCFEFRRAQTFAGVKYFTYDVSAVANIYGLGYSIVEVHERCIDMRTRLWVLATPVDGDTIELTLANQLRSLRRPLRPFVGLRFLPVGLRTRIMSKILIHYQKNDVLQDVVIWDRKQYRPQPALCRSDGEIGKFRHYCKQFYPEGQVCSKTDAERISKRC